MVLEKLLKILNQVGEKNYLSYFSVYLLQFVPIVDLMNSTLVKNVDFLKDLIVVYIVVAIVVVKNEDDPKNEDQPKIEDDSKSEDDPENEDGPKN